MLINGLTSKFVKTAMNSNKNGCVGLYNYNLLSKYFSMIRIFTASTTIDGNKETTKSMDINNVLIQHPLDAFAGILSACELHSIMYEAKKSKVSIEKAEIKVIAVYDVDNFTGKNVGGRNTFNSIDVEANITSSEPNKNKLLEVVEKGENLCPLLNTVKLAGVKVNAKINLL